MMDFGLWCGDWDNYNNQHISHGECIYLQISNSRKQLVRRTPPLEEFSAPKYVIASVLTHHNCRLLKHVLFVGRPSFHEISFDRMNKSFSTISRVCQWLDYYMKLSSMGMGRWPTTQFIKASCYAFHLKRRKRKRKTQRQQQQQRRRLFHIIV